MGALKVIMAAGGTGGHLWPAISLARAIQKKIPDADFLFIGTGRPIEEKMLGPAGFKRRIIKSSGLKGQGLAGAVKALWQCLASIAEARSIIRDFKPDLCFGAGGYVTVPVGLAAKISGVPLVIHEQNSRPGLSNKILGRMAAKVMLGFAEAGSSFPPNKTVVTGNPVRPEIAALAGRAGAPHQPPVLSVTGGSQGAAGLNRLVVPALIRLKEDGGDFRLYHQTGDLDLQWVAEAYQKAGLAAEVKDFYQDMTAFYERSDLVIGRAGAITIAELAMAGLPAVLVPLPTAADDHQSVNARHMEEGGAALLKPERTTSPEELADDLKRLLADEKALKKMSAAASALARPAADEEMARICLESASGCS